MNEFEEKEKNQEFDDVPNHEQAAEQNEPSFGNPYAGTYYNPPQTQNNTFYPEVETPVSPWEQPTPLAKKKSKKAGVTIIIIMVVCIGIAVIGMALSSSGIISGNDADKKTTTSANASDVETKDSNATAIKDSNGNLTVAGVAEKSMDSCVGISVYSNQSNMYGDFYGYGSNNSDSDGSSVKSGEGSGVIMSEQNGKTYIITCAHVISSGDSFKVTLNNGDEYDAKMVGYDSQTDIGVLVIEKTGFKVAAFAKSENVSVGEQVVAIGCPGGIEFMNSVTSGYISALDRPVESSSIGYDNECIQTDAAINPGNSGGALFNMQGQVIGINSSKIASTEYEGMGFAVPSTTAINTANSLIRVGYVEGRAKLGITYTGLSNYKNGSSILSALESKGFKNAQGTMVINEISSDSNLKSKDVKQYDMIVAVNGETMTSTDIMTSILSDSSPGDTVKLTIARIQNNEIKTFEVDCKLIENKGE